jgi:hypothetical protein
MTDFLLDPGTSGFIATPFNLMTTELNTLASGSAATSSVGGTSGVFSQTNFGSAIELEFWFLSGGAFTPTAGGTLACWWLKSTDGGTTFEALISTPSTSVPALGRPPDLLLPLYEGGAAWASNNIRNGIIARAPYPFAKLVTQNFSGVSLPASGNIIKAAPVAWKF